jgi:hypothetical protein
MTDFDPISAAFRWLMARRGSDQKDGTNSDPIQAFLNDIARKMPARSLRALRLLEEFEDHLRERASQLQREGVNEEEAVAAAIAQFGSAGEVLRRFELEFPIESEVDAMIRKLQMSVAALTFLFGAVFLAFSGFDDDRHAMFITKIVASIVIMACSFVLFHQGWTTRPLANWQRGLALASSIVSIALGSAGGVFTAHLGLVTGDWESYAFFGAALLLLQGTLATLPLVLVDSDRPNLAA